MKDPGESVPDLRTFLAANPALVFRPDGPLSVIEEITAVLHALESDKRQPVVMIDEPVRADGTRSDMPVLCNLTGSREVCAAALGLADHRDSARHCADLAAGEIAPVAVGRVDAPVQTVVAQGDRADLGLLPALKQHGGDAGHYITAGHVVTADPETGIDNMAIQRCWVRESRLMGIYPYPTSHNWLNVAKYWDRGEPCPVAIWIGHHPALVIGTQAKFAYPKSHWAAAGAALGSPVRLVPSITHGDPIKVPADAEIVIEGFIPPNRLEAEGPFAEFTGYQGPQIANPVVEVTAITRRADAIYQDCGAGLADHLVPDNLAMEGAIFAMCRNAAPTLRRVHVPISGRRFHAYLQFENPRPGEVRDALTAALSYRRLKAVMAFDEDIDIFDDSQAMWALATRLQWDRDTIRIDRLSEANLDPSTPPGAGSTTKVALDATLPPPRRTGAPKPAPRVNRVNEDALETARAAVDAADPAGWPRA